MSDALEAIVDAAIDRALVTEADARRYFALAGVLERVRGHDGGDAGDPVDASLDGDPLGAALVSTVAVRSLDATRKEGIDAGAWSPGDDGPHAAFVRLGAAAAVRRSDADVDVVSARSGVPRRELTELYAASSTGTVE
ncbi:hypothetical protein DVK02_11975 [Halobellus sp. Atlit-31R]|nr:hypothetical protein DVK02_11975 [Halobellus sp. Atlit-31R]